MSMRRMIVGLMGFAAAMALFSGCATTGYDKAERSAVSMGNTKAEIQNAYGQVTVVIKSLDKVMGAQVGDLRPLYEDFAAQVKMLQSAAESARSRALSMQAKNQDYFSTWAQEIENIQNPTMKSQSLQRYKTTQASYTKVEQTLFKTRDAYVPLISTLNDLQTAMGQDLTPSGISGLRPVSPKARQQAITLQGVMKESMAAIDAASRQMTPNASGSIK
jgi:hypothetical protein